MSHQRGEFVEIELLPVARVLRVERGASLQDVLFAQGVEFPCGGRGRCKGCKIKVLSGSLPVTDEDQQRLTPAELSQGWRLACRARADGPVKLDLAQWEAAILSDDSVFPFKPQEGCGVAIDLGTTTIVGQLLDLTSGHVLAVRSELNSQAKHGADIMSRVEFALTSHGQASVQKVIRDQICAMITGLLQVRSPGFSRRHVSSTDGSKLNDKSIPASAPPAEGGTPNLKAIVLVGNTVMHHLFCGLEIEPLSRFPFEPTSAGLQTFSAFDLGWSIPGNPVVHFLPCFGGFVGSDILAGVLATKLHESKSLVALLDLGTNGEIVVGNRDRLLCTSTAAGPAFEGARISMGMRAATGAISEVHVEGTGLRCHVLGDTAPRGICGSGLVDAVAAGLNLGWVGANGRLTRGDTIPLAAPIQLNQRDIRELQLAKGAIAAGLRLLLQQWGAAELTRVYLAGAFGNYINQASARRIGLLDFPAEKVQPAGNTALLGAKLALFSLNEKDPPYTDILNKTTCVSLNEDPHFQETFAEQMGFPEK